MKMTLDLPADLVKEVKLLAVHEDQNLKDAVADLLRKGLAAPAGGASTVVKADKVALKRRKGITRKFVSGEWGVELEGVEAGREADRRGAAQRAKAWRD